MEKARNEKHQISKEGSTTRHGGIFLSFVFCAFTHLVLVVLYFQAAFQACRVPLRFDAFHFVLCPAGAVFACGHLCLDSHNKNLRETGCLTADDLFSAIQYA